MPRKSLVSALATLGILAGLGGCASNGGSKDGRLAFEATPGTVTAGEILPPVTVLVQSSSGRSTKSSAAVTLFLEANPPGATLSGTLTVNAVRGVATFADLSINRASDGYQLAAFSPDRAPAVSDVFAIAPPTGALVPATGSPYSIGTDPAALAVDPTGQFLYAAAPSGLYAFAIEDDGTLSEIAGSPFTQGGNPTQIVVDSSGRFVYATNLFSAVISGWSIGTAGALVAIPDTSGTAFAPRTPLVADPTGKRLFAGGAGVGVVAFTFDETGTATTAPGSPFATPSAPLAMAVDPSGQFLAVADNFGYVKTFGIAANGTLTAIAFPDAIAGSASTSMAIDHTGSFVYLADALAFGIYGFALAGDGSLTTVSNSPFFVGSVARLGLAAHPSADFLYIVSNNDIVRSMAITSSGELAFFFATPQLTDGANTAIAIDPQGEHVFVTSNGPATGEVWVYEVVP